MLINMFQVWKLFLSLIKHCLKCPSSVSASYLCSRNVNIFIDLREWINQFIPIKCTKEDINIFTEYKELRNQLIPFRLSEKHIEIFNDFKELRNQLIVVFYGAPKGTCRWNILCRAHDLLSRAHHLLSRAHDLLTRSHDLLSRVHEIGSRAHDLVWPIRYQLFCGVDKRAVLLI